MIRYNDPIKPYSNGNINGILNTIVMTTAPTAELSVSPYLKSHYEWIKYIFPIMLLKYYSLARLTYTNLDSKHEIKLTISLSLRQFEW